MVYSLFKEHYVQDSGNNLTLTIITFYFDRNHEQKKILILARYSSGIMIKTLQSDIDTGLIKLFLKMTPEERLQSNDNTIRTLMELKNAYQNKAVENRSKRAAERT